MYKLVSLSSLFIRQFLLPNPFSALPNSELYNCLATLLLVPITYYIVGLFYERGTAPAFGSFLFLVFYLIHTGILILCGFYFSTVACVVIAGIYFAILIGGAKLRNKLYLGF